MIIVSDTSSITNLAAINQLHLLKLLYKSIIIPQAVYLELTKNNVPGTKEVQTFSWIITKSVQNKEEVEHILNSKNNIHLGEIEAIILAIEINANLLLMDEKRGRNLALSYQLSVTGLLGILLQAKEKKLISSVKKLMDDMIKIANFRVSKELYQQMLNIAQE